MMISTLYPNVVSHHSGPTPPRLLGKTLAEYHPSSAPKSLTSGLASNLCLFGGHPLNCLGLSLLIAEIFP